MNVFRCLSAPILVIAVALSAAPTFAVTLNPEDPLPSWNEGPSKQSIITFVEQTTTAGSPSFIPIQDRIATFDNDGTLWSEMPYYNQFAFAVDRIRQLGLAVIVHHTDETREWAYDRHSSIGKLDQALTVGGANGWTIVDMEKDWKQVWQSPD